MDPLFPALPEDLSALTDEALAEALAARLATVTAIEEENAEVLGDRTADVIVADLTSGVEQIEAIRAEQNARVEAAEEYQGTVAELAARAKPAEERRSKPKARRPQPRVTATARRATKKPTTRRKAQPRARPRARPDPPRATRWRPSRCRRGRSRSSQPRRSSAASGARPSRRERQPLAAEDGRAAVHRVGRDPGRSRRESRSIGSALAKALMEVQRVTSARGRTSRSGCIVASAHASYPEERQLDDDAAPNTERIEAVTGRAGARRVGRHLRPADPAVRPADPVGRGPAGEGGARRVPGDTGRDLRADTAVARGRRGRRRGRDGRGRRGGRHSRRRRTAS